MAGEARAFLRWLLAWSPASLARRAAELDAREDRLAMQEQIAHNRDIHAYNLERSAALNRKNLLDALRADAEDAETWWTRATAWAKAHGTAVPESLRPPTRKDAN